MWNLAARLTIWSFGFAALGLIAAPIHTPNKDQQRRYAIILPLTLIAGQPATFAVLTANGNVASGTRVVLSNGEVVSTDDSGRAHFLVPSDVGVMFARIPGTEVSEASDVLPQASSGVGLQVTKVPKIVALGNQFAINGHGFQGDADRNRITMDGKAIFVLASSPVQLIVTPAANVPPGQASLTITEGLAETVTDVTLVDVTSLNSSSAQIHRGKKTETILLVRGTEEPLDLKIRSLSPEIVQLAQSHDAYVRTTGGSDNSAVVQLKGESAGSFSFAISLENSAVKVNVPLARDFLSAAQKGAEPDVANRIENILRRLPGKNIEVRKTRNDLQRLLTEGRPGDFRALIHGALRALNDE
jgi:hypothetical protein